MVSILFILLTLVYAKSSADTFSNSSSVLHPLPEIQKGYPCIKGQMYKMSCNTCHCAENNALLCTKMACLEDVDIKYLKRVRDEKVKRLRRRGDSETLRKPRGKTCVPGKLYRDGCKLCSCSYKRKLSCKTYKNCKKYLKLSNVKSLTDVRPLTTEDDFWQLPLLPHGAAKCEPGKTYRIDCNACFCIDNGNLLCEKQLCLDKNKRNSALAKKLSGKPCKKDINLPASCVFCKCIKRRTACKPLWGCTVPNRIKLHGRMSARPILDLTVEKCEPNAVYKDNCNNCYCQSDQTLRCTRKSCLNYRQVLTLKKHNEYLDQHGL